MKMTLLTFLMLLPLFAPLKDPGKVSTAQNCSQLVKANKFGQKLHKESLL